MPASSRAKPLSANRPVLTPVRGSSLAWTAVVAGALLAGAAVVTVVTRPTTPPAGSVVEGPAGATVVDVTGAAVVVVVGAAVVDVVVDAAVVDVVGAAVVDVVGATVVDVVVVGGAGSSPNTSSRVKRLPFTC